MDPLHRGYNNPLSTYARKWWSFELFYHEIHLKKVCCTYIASHDINISSHPPIFAGSIPGKRGVHRCGGTGAMNAPNVPLFAKISGSPPEKYPGSGRAPDSCAAPLTHP